MKTILLFLCLSLISLRIHSQNTTIDTIQKDTTKLLKTQDSLTLKIKTDSLRTAIMQEKWDTINFDPYRYQAKKYPFQISFTDSTYASPIPKRKVITSRYGWRNRRPHKGIDIDLITGDNVMAMFDGKVRYIKYHSGHGKTIIVRHYNGLETVYAHLSKYLVKVNDTVKKGQVIGKGGTTGNARGSHLHLVASYKGAFINPEYLFRFNSKNTIRNQNIWVTKDWTTPYLHSSKRQSKIVLLDTYEKAIASQKKQKQIYVIKKGDTLSGIASKYRIPITKICKTNGIAKTSTLKIGQKLVLTQ